MRNRLFYSIIIFLFCLKLNGQLSTSFALQKMDSLSKINLKSSLKKSQRVVIDRIKKDFNGKVKNSLIEQYKEYAEAFEKEINEDKYLLNTAMDSLLYKIYSKINLQSYIEKPIFLIAKDYTYNAFCTPEGIIIINMAVFNHAENEDQIATIICHELAHHHLNHFIKGSAALLEDEFSKKSKKQIEAIKEGKNSSENAMLLLKKKLYQNSKLKRKHELQADSLGFQFYKNSSFSRGAFINSLEFISEIDSIKFIDTIDNNIYKELFDIPGYTFSYDLLKDETTSGYTYFEQKEDFDIDSLSSHPEYVERSMNLKTLFSIERDTLKIQKSHELSSIYKYVSDELLPLLYFNEEYGIALYATLQLLSQSKEDKEQEKYKSWIGILFDKLVEARSTYTFNRYVDKRSPEIINIDYRKFLNLIWNLSLSDMKVIKKAYHKYIKN